MSLIIVKGLIKRDKFFVKLALIKRDGVSTLLHLKNEKICCVQNLIGFGAVTAGIQTV
jgi:hypothetical protein